MKNLNVGIKGIGSYVPPNILTNEEIDLFGVGTDADWTKKKLGILERRVVGDENTSDLAYHAAVNAISDANINKGDIDLIIMVTSSPDRMSPSTGCITAERLGIECPAFDINAVCSGFIYGIQLATNLVSTKQYENVLIVAAETYSKITDWTDRNCVFFGDGAGAVVISKTNDGWISSEIYADGKGKEIFTCHHNQKYQMNVKAVYNFATQTLPFTILDSLQKYQLSIDDITWLIPHQPSISVLKKTAEILRLPIERVVLNMTNYGNTAGASIPMALDSIYQKNKLKNGDLLVMPAVGSGWTWGVAIIKYFKL